MLEKYVKGLLSWLWAPWFWFKANMQRKEVEWERKKKEEKKRKNKRPKLPVKRHNAAWVKKHSLH